MTFEQAFIRRLRMDDNDPYGEADDNYMVCCTENGPDHCRYMVLYLVKGMLRTGWIYLTNNNNAGTIRLILDRYAGHDYQWLEQQRQQFHEEPNSWHVLSMEQFVRFTRAEEKRQ